MKDQAERLREMISAMRNAGPEGKKAYVYCITSGKGGVGKTSFTVNFALALARCGKKVAIIDADFGFSNVNIMLGANSRYNLAHVVSGERHLTDVMEECYPNVWYIAGGSGVTELLQLNEQRLENMIGQLGALETLVDYILFDTGGGMTNSILRLIDASDETILVLTSEPTSILDGYVVLKTASGLKDKPRIRTLINKADSETGARETHKGFSIVVSKYLNYQIDMLGYVVEDSKMTESITKFVPHIIKHPTSAASRQIQHLAEQVTKTKDLYAKERSIKSFFSRFLRGGK